MSNNWKTVITTAATLTALAGGSALYAQSTTQPMPKSGEGTMMQGQPGDMMNMMTQMSQMMDTCNSMMKDMGKDHKPDTHKEIMKPEKKS